MLGLSSDPYIYIYRPMCVFTYICVMCVYPFFFYLSFLIHNIWAADEIHNQEKNTYDSLSLKAYFIMQCNVMFSRLHLTYAPVMIYTVTFWVCILDLLLNHLLSFLINMAFKNWRSSMHTRAFKSKICTAALCRNVEWGPSSSYARRAHSH